MDLRLPPGPKGLPILGNLPARRRDPLGLYLSAFRTHGDVVYLPMGPMRVILVSDPDLVKRVLQDATKIYVKGWVYRTLRGLFGDGLLTSEGEDWRRQRRLTQPAFHRASLEAIVRAMDECVGETLESLSASEKTGAPVDAFDEMMKLTLEIAARTLLGSSIPEAEKRELSKHVSFVIQEADRQLLSSIPLPVGFPTPRNLRTKRAIREIDRVLFRVIEGRLREPADAHRDLLGLLMGARDEETGQGMSARQLRDEVMTFFVAGHETTANALSWLWILLSQHPEARRRVEREVAEEFTGRPVTIETLMGLTWCQAVIQETLRLYPPAWVLPRDVVADDELGGFAVPKGSIVVVSPYVVHRHPRHWENPEGFDPERFLGPGGKERHKFSYFPFSGGPRQCIGSQFAMLEATLTLARVAERFRLDLVPTGATLEPRAQITLRPDGRVWTTVRERR